MHATELIRKYRFPVDNSYMIFNLTDYKPSIIESIHNLAYRYDGIIMEGFLNYSLGLTKDFNIKYSNDLFKCISFVNDIKLNQFKEKHADIPMLDIISNIYYVELNDYINIIKNIISKKECSEDTFNIISDDISVTIPFDIASKNIHIYLICYLLDHLSKHNEQVKIDEFKIYITAFISNMNEIEKYINQIANKLKGFSNDSSNIYSSIEISYNKNSIDIKGEADLIIKDWLFDIKCSIESKENIDSWHRQLEVYNEYLNKNNIAIINILNNHLIIYHSKDDFHNYNLMKYTRNDFAGEFSDLITSV